MSEKTLQQPFILSRANLEKLIVKEWYHVVPDTTTTVCALTLANSFTVIGESSTISKETFDEEAGRKYAKEDAIAKMWQLEGYLLRTLLVLQEREDSFKNSIANRLTPMSVESPEEQES